LRKIRVVLAALPVAAVLVLAGSALAEAGPPVRTTLDVTGDVFICNGEEYTVTSGELLITEHVRTTPSGHTHVRFHAIPRQVVLEDEAGNQYRAVGALNAKFHAHGQTGREHGGARAKINIVGPGGLAGTAHEQDQFLPTGEERLRDRGDCQFPD
jgi:hypothetical protein